MKTNKEKYPNTDDALAAWKKHREECKCDCEFELWLKLPCDEEIKKAAKDMPRGLGLALAGLVAGSLVADAIKGRFKDEKPKDGADDKRDGLKCPLCGGEHGRFGIVAPIFVCPDCGASISKGGCFDREEFREWYSGLTK
jgi:ribosomal protein L37AE/L43A